MTTAVELPNHCLEPRRWEYLHGEKYPVICSSRAVVRRWVDASGAPQAACRHHVARRLRRYPEMER